MSLSMQLWEIDKESLSPMESASLNLEKRLETWLEKDISLIGIDVLIIGRQVQTSYGGFIDLLAIDSEGKVVIIELKRSKTPRDIVAQCLDYGAWVYELEYDDLSSIYEDYAKKDLAKSFKDYFDIDYPEDDNRTYQIIIVAESLDDSTERIVQHLNDVYTMNINAVFFNVFKKDSHEYIGRSWLQDPIDVEDKSQKRRKLKSSGFKYVNTGITDENDREWELNRKYGFISAGGGSRWINAIKRLRKGDKIIAHIKKKGYVGYGIVEEEAVLVKNFIYEGKPIVDCLPDKHSWKETKDPLKDEWLAKVKWIKTFEENDAKWFKGAFANQNVVCEIRDEETVEFVRKEFLIGKEDS